MQCLVKAKQQTATETSRSASRRVLGSVQTKLSSRADVPYVPKRPFYPPRDEQYSAVAVVIFHRRRGVARASCTPSPYTLIHEYGRQRASCSTPKKSIMRARRFRHHAHDNTIVTSKRATHVSTAMIDRKGSHVPACCGTTSSTRFTRRRLGNTEGILCGSSIHVDMKNSCILQVL